MDKKKKLLVFGVIAFIIIWIGAVFWANLTQKSQGDSANRRVAVYTVPAPKKVFGEGQFRYRNEVSFTPDASKGTINKIYVKDGQNVNKGQVLFDYRNEQAIQQCQELEKELAALSARKYYQCSLGCKSRRYFWCGIRDSWLLGGSCSGSSCCNSIRSSFDNLSVKEAKEHEENLLNNPGFFIVSFCYYTWNEHLGICEL